MDRRILRIETDHAQDRLKRPRINFTLRGEDFIDGVLVGTWVNPITKKLQPIPNSEEADYQTQNAGRFKKLGLADVDLIDSNSGAGEFVSFGPDHTDQGIKYSGENLTGCGYKTKVAWAQNTGNNVAFYAYGQGTDQDGILGEVFYADDQNLTGGGVGIKYLLDGRIEVYKDEPSQPVWRGSFTGGGYTPGTVRGGSYARATDEYVFIRVEVSDTFLTITSSRAGIAQFKTPWGIDRYDDSGTLTNPAEPILPNKKFGVYVPKGGFAVIASPVVYGFENPYAISKQFSFAEVPTYVGPGGTDVLTGRVIPYSPDVTVTLKKPDGTTAYDRDSKDFKARVDFAGTAFVCGVAGSYPRIATQTSVPDGGPFDVSDWVLSCSPFNCEDGPDGAGYDLILNKSIIVDGESVPIPSPFIEEVELRPIRLSLIPHPDDADAPDPIVLLDGVGGPPEWVDFPHAEEGKAIHIRVSDRMALVREAKWRETVVFDGVPFCAPPGDPDLAGQESFVALHLREGGIRSAELVDLPRVENPDGSLFTIDDTPPQIAGEWNFAAKTRQLVEDSLIDGWEMAPAYAWGLRPTIDGTRAYAVDVTTDETEVCTFHRTIESAELDPAYEENEVGAYPLIYGQPHRRINLPKEGNVVRVVGRDPGTGDYISAFLKDASSADPEAAIGPDKLGVPREVFRRLRALTTRAAVNAVASALYATVAQRQYTHSWPAFMRFLEDGSPVWRTDMVLLKAANPDGSDAKIRVSGFSADLIDENGGGLMDAGGRKAPVSIRLADYSGGALCGNGGATAWEVARRQRERVKDGGVSIGLNENIDTSQGLTNDLS